MNGQPVGATAASRPRSRAPAEAVEVQGEVVVYALGQVHVLNPTATLIWKRCDGDIELRELASQLAAEFGIDPDEVVRDVVEIVDKLVAWGLVDIAPDGPRPPPSVSKPLLEPAALCSGCGSGPSYDSHVFIDVGHAVVSVGADEEIADAVETAFGARAVGRLGATADRPSYGVVAPTRRGDRGRFELARLHRGPDVLLRSRDPYRVLRALVSQVSTHALPAEHLVLEGIAVGRAGRVVLMANPLNRVAFERAVARIGLCSSDTPVSVIRIDPPAVVVGSGWSEIDLAPLRDVAARRNPGGGDPPPLAWGTYELGAIMVTGAPNAASVLGELGPVPWPDLQDVPNLDGLLGLARSVPILSGVSLERAAALVDAPLSPSV